MAAKLLAIAETTKKAIWLTRFLNNIAITQHPSIIVSSDNQGAIALVKNPVFQKQTKNHNYRYIGYCTV